MCLYLSLGVPKMKGRCLEFWLGFMWVQFITRDLSTSRFIFASPYKATYTTKRQNNENNLCPRPAHWILCHVPPERPGALMASSKCVTKSSCWSDCFLLIVMVYTNNKYISKINWAPKRNLIILILNILYYPIILLYFNFRFLGPN